MVSYAEAQIMAGASHKAAQVAAVKEREEKISAARDRLYQAYEENQSDRILQGYKIAYFEAISDAWRQYNHDLETIERKYVSITAQQSPGLLYERGEQMVGHRRPEVSVRRHVRRRA